MDAFSWFVGIYEGEGSISGFTAKDRSSSKRWELQIKMCDQDTIDKVANYLGVKTRPVTAHLRKNPHWSPAWCIQLRDREKLWRLGIRMYRHLSKRRQAQWDVFFDDILKLATKYKGTPHSWRYDFIDEQCDSFAIIEDSIIWKTSQTKDCL